MTTQTAPANPRTKKPLRFKIGVGFVILCGVLYLGIIASLFLPVDPIAKAAVIGGVIVAAEASLLIGIACMGKEAYQAIKARFRPKKTADVTSAS